MSLKLKRDLIIGEREGTSRGQKLGRDARVCSGKTEIGEQLSRKPFELIHPPTVVLSSQQHHALAAAL